MWIANTLNGMGSIISADGKERYEGNFRNSLKEDFGIEHCRDGSRFQGQFKEGKRHGSGNLVLASGETYDG